MPERRCVNLPAPLTAVRVVSGPDDPSAGGDASGDGPAAASAEADALEAERRALEAERAALARVRGALETAAAQVADHLAGILADAEAQLVDLAVEIARKVVAQEIQAGRCDIEPIVREALDRAPANRECVVHLHPDDLATLHKTGETTPDLAHLRLEADPGVGRGECVVETAEGTVEARIDDRLNEVRAAMTPSESP
ncbi:MAG: flagellar assembly protein FliH [Phycisphaerae bacterium]